MLWTTSWYVIKITVTGNKLKTIPRNLIEKYVIFIQTGILMLLLSDKISHYTKQ